MRGALGAHASPIRASDGGLIGVSAGRLVLSAP
jgi:hypothetical protein